LRVEYIGVFTGNCNPMGVLPPGVVEARFAGSSGFGNVDDAQPFSIGEVGVIPLHGYIRSKPRRIEGADQAGVRGVRDIQDAQAFLPIGDIGVIPGKIQASGIANGAVGAGFSWLLRIGNVQDAQASFPVGDVGVVPRVRDAPGPILG
jgi:hypothetical protein